MYNFADIFALLASILQGRWPYSAPISFTNNLYGIWYFGRDITKYTVTHGVHNQFWQTLPSTFAACAVAACE